jgi:hypothetical protein
LLPPPSLLFWSESSPLAAAAEGNPLEHTDQHDRMLLFVLLVLWRSDVMKCCCS